MFPYPPTPPLPPPPAPTPPPRPDPPQKPTKRQNGKIKPPSFNYRKISDHFRPASQVSEVSNEPRADIREKPCTETQLIFERSLNLIPEEAHCRQ